MNTKVITGIIIVVIIAIVAVFFIGKYTTTPMKMPQQSSTSDMQATPGPSVATTAVAKNAVTIQNFAFSPATLTVKVGDSVTWTNQDSVGHSATADDGSFDTGVLPQGQSKSITFSKAGTYTYHCSVHPNMKATIVVQ